MAKLVQAFTAFGPKIDLQAATPPSRFLELITQRTTLSNGVVKNVQENEVETLIGLLNEGRPVHTGIAIFTPTVDLEGNINISVRVDKRIREALNTGSAFKGKITNRANIGMTSQEMTNLWNKEHPDNPIPV
jgi:hypothetical protein